jgi:DNA helicase HerA-like ATPase
MIDASGNLLIGKSDKELYIMPKMANRHGLIAGATGTGKTVSLQVLAETFSAIGVPSFLADVKGDLSGIARAASDNPKIAARVQDMKLSSFTRQACPVCFWDLYGEKGHPLRTTISEMGPLLLSRLLNLNEVQSGVLNLVFRMADDDGLLLLDLKDLRKMVEFAGENHSKFTSEYGNISPASIGTIQRGLLVLEEQGVEKFFGEPALNLMDFIQTDNQGRGIVNILAADKLMQSPTLYSTFLLWLLAELFEQLPETGDPEKPKLLFFFDEAHLLFDEAPKVLLEKIEQVVRLIRSKGIGVYFITQNPLDVADKVLGQLGNRIQHAIRAYTPKDLKAVKAAAETFRANPAVNVEETITQLGVGEALVSFLDEKGVPSMVEIAKIVPPQSQIGAIDEEERKRIIQHSTVFGAYEKTVDRESAYEILHEKMEQQKAEEQQQEFEKKRMKEEQQQERQRRSKRSPGGVILRDITKYAGRSVTRQIGTTIGRQIVRGILGSLMGKG